MPYLLLLLLVHGLHLLGRHGLLPLMLRMLRVLLL
jgi:hypothetical protein